MSFSDDMKKKIDELEVERRLKELADEADKTVGETLEKAGALAHERRDEVEGWLGKATEAVNTKTKGQYAEKVEKVRTGLLDGLDKLAAKRRMEPVAEIDAPGGDGAAPGDPAADAAASPDVAASGDAPVESAPADSALPDEPEQSRPDERPDQPEGPAFS